MSSANDLIPSYSFEVTLDSVSSSFSKVSNICGNIQYDSYVEGGVNDAPVIFRKPKSTPDTLILERGVTDSIKGKVFAVIKEGCKISEIQINVLKNGKTVRTFYANNGVIVGRQFSDLDASESSVMYETLQIIHQLPPVAPPPAPRRRSASSPAIVSVRQANPVGGSRQVGNNPVPGGQPPNQQLQTALQNNREVTLRQKLVAEHKAEKDNIRNQQGRQQNVAQQLQPPPNELKEAAESHQKAQYAGLVGSGLVAGTQLFNMGFGLDQGFYKEDTPDPKEKDKDGKQIIHKKGDYKEGNDWEPNEKYFNGATSIFSSLIGGAGNITQLRLNSQKRKITGLNRKKWELGFSSAGAIAGLVGNTSKLFGGINSIGLGYHWNDKTKKNEVPDYLKAMKSASPWLSGIATAGNLLGTGLSYTGGLIGSGMRRYNSS